MTILLKCLRFNNSHFDNIRLLDFNKNLIEILKLTVLIVFFKFVFV